MNVSFSGLKNATCTYIVNSAPYQRTINQNTYNITNSKDIVLNVQLDNNGDNDLDNFREILKKYPSDGDKNSLSFTYAEKFISNDTKKGEYSLNGKKLELCDGNLALFSKLSKLMDKMSDRKSFVQEETYTNTPDFVRKIYVIISTFAKYLSGTDTSAVVEYALEPKRISAAANHMQKQIQKDMTDYFTEG